MSSEVLHRVDSDRPFPLIRFTGVLDATTAGQVRSTLLDVLAGQPEAVVVDVAGLQPHGDDPGAVLRHVRRDTADWPAADLALCDPHDRWPDTGWPVWPDSAHAFAGLGEPNGTRFSLDLEPHVGAARHSRELVNEACDRWSRPQLADAACIVVTELVNNVVAHARTPMIVLVAAHGDGVSVAVRDRSETVPVYTGEPVEPTTYGGRGMLLVDSVAARWGSLPLAGGKVVWALLAADPTPPGPYGDHEGGASMAGPIRG